VTVLLLYQFTSDNDTTIFAPEKALKLVYDGRNKLLASLNCTFMNSVSSCYSNWYKCGLYAK